MPTDIVTQAERIVARIDTEAAAAAMEHILSTGDLSKLSARERVGYYLYLCAELGIA